MCISHLQLISVLTGHISSIHDHIGIVAATSDRAGPGKGRSSHGPFRWNENMVEGEQPQDGWTPFQFGADTRKALLYRPTLVSQETAFPSPKTHTHTDTQTHTHTHAHAHAHAHARSRISYRQPFSEVNGQGVPVMAQQK